VFNTRLGLVVRVRLRLVVAGRCCWGPRWGGITTLQNMVEQFLWTFIVYGVGWHTVVYGALEWFQANNNLEDHEWTLAQQ
jgi:hypothetical protein